MVSTALLRVPQEIHIYIPLCMYLCLYLPTYVFLYVSMSLPTCVSTCLPMRLSTYISGLPLWLSRKESACKAGGVDLIPGLGRSPGGGKGNPLQCSCQDNPMDRGAWQATVHRVAKSGTRLTRLSISLLLLFDLLGKNSCGREK